MPQHDKSQTWKAKHLAFFNQFGGCFAVSEGHVPDLSHGFESEMFIRKL